MSMLRQSSLNQLKRINDEIKKQGGATDRTSDSEKGFPNAMWIHNPIDADKSGKRKVATYDQMFSIDIPDADTKVKMKNEKIYYYDKNAKKRVMMKRNNRITNENIVKINGYEYFYDDIKNKLYSDKTKTNEIDVYKQLTKNEREQLQNCIKYRKNENMKLNEGKVKQALQDAIDEYYLEDNGDAVDIISQLTGLNFDQVITILDISSQDNAMENLMEQDYKKNEIKNMKNIMSFDKMFEKVYEKEILNEDKMMNFLSNNFQKITKEIQKNSENIQHVADELNNIVKINKLKR